MSTSRTAAVTSRGEGCHTLGQSSYLGFEVVVVGEVGLLRSRDGCNGGVSNLDDLVGHVSQRVEVHGIGDGG